MKEKIFKLAKTEAEWMRYYGFVNSRIEEKFEDIDFYDRMIPIGYSKVYTPLVHKCPMGYVNSLDTDIAEVVYGPRDHDKGVYTPLEFVIYNKIEGYSDLIKLIKDQ